MESGFSAYTVHSA